MFPHALFTRLPAWLARLRPPRWLPSSPASPSLPTSAPRSSARQPWALYVAPLLDEWTTGFLVVALPQLRAQVGLSYEQIGALFAIGALAALVYDPVLALLSDLRAKWPPMIFGMFALVACYLLAGFAGNFAVLAVAFALLWPATSTALDLAQMLLIDLAPHASARTMTRWTLLSGIGDLLAPLSVALFLALRFGWTALCLLAAGLWLGAALLNLLWRPLAVRPATETSKPPAHAANAGMNVATSAGESVASTPGDEAGDEKVPLLVTLRRAVRDPLLLRWLAVATIASMLDEIFLGFAGLTLTDHLHVSADLVSLALLANLVGGMLGLILLERILGRFAGARVLPGYILVALLGMVGFLLAPGVVPAVAALFLVGLGASGWYPVAMAAAYDTHPGHSGIVRAVYAFGSPFEVLLPGIVGFLAGRFGLLVGVGFLGLAPLLALIALPRASIQRQAHRDAPQ